ncbi:MAG: hypothetical protein WAQ27_04310 [Candidatus Microsaccharimonas sp.]
MGFNRALLQSPGMPFAARQGAGLLANLNIEEITADAAATITVAQIQRGGVNFTGFTAGRNLTTPTHTLLTAAFPEMDIGDSIAFFVSIQDAFAGTWVAGDANVVLAGRATTPASSWSLVNVTRTADSGANRTYLWRVM